MIEEALFRMKADRIELRAPSRRASHVMDRAVEEDEGTTEERGRTRHAA
jgi:hypothetical protein